MGSTLEKIEQLELRLDLVLIQLQTLATKLDDLDAKLAEFDDSDV